MKKIITGKTVKILMNLIILFIFLQGGSIIADKAYTLLITPEEIEPIRLEIPWLRPVSDVTIMLHKDMLEQQPKLRSEVSKNIFTHDLIKRTAIVAMLILFLFQIKRLLISINTKSFFEAGNLNIIRHLSFLVIIWVIINFLLYQIIPAFIPLDLMYERINFVALNESLWGSIMASIDFKMLFVALILYVTVVSFEQGYKLKEEADLTI